MSNDQGDDFFPGFQEDDKPAAPAPMPSAMKSDGAFNPFDEPVNVSLVPSPSAPAPAAPKSQCKPSSAGQQGAGFDPFAGNKDGEEADDPDLKPGSRKDLWICPHCGAGNRPNRDTCRSCGKSPMIPWPNPGICSLWY